MKKLLIFGILILVVMMSGCTFCRSGKGAINLKNIEHGLSSGDGDLRAESWVCAGWGKIDCRRCMPKKETCD